MRDKTFSLILAAALVLALGGSLAAGERGERGRRGDSGRFGQSAHGPRFGMRGPHGTGRFASRGFGPGRFGLAFSPAGLSRLELSPEQRTQAIEVLTTHFRAGLEAGMALQDAREKVRDLRQAASTDADAIVAAHRALGEAQGQLAVARLKAREDFTAILTPEQLEKFKRFGQGTERRGGMGWDADAEADLDANSDAGLDADADPDPDAADAP